MSTLKEMRQQRIHEAFLVVKDCPTEDVFNFGIRWAEGHPAWISATGTSLPKRLKDQDVSDYVLVWTASGTLDMSYYDYAQHTFVDVWDGSRVTHWMAQPLPPEGDRKD